MFSVKDTIFHLPLRYYFGLSRRSSYMVVFLLRATPFLTPVSSFTCSNIHGSFLGTPQHILPQGISNAIMGQYLLTALSLAHTHFHTHTREQAVQHCTNTVFFPHPPSLFLHFLSFFVSALSLLHLQCTLSHTLSPSPEYRISVFLFCLAEAYVYCCRRVCPVVSPSPLD